LPGCIGHVPRAIAGLSIQILGGALQLIHSAFGLNFRVSRNAAKGFLGLATNVPRRAGDTIFVHFMLSVDPVTRDNAP
jgi:hypothetical protein